MTFSVTQARGTAYELSVKRILEERGYSVRHLAAENYHNSDLELADGVLVEVKGSVPHKINQRRQGYSFQLHRFGMSAPIAERVVILYCETPSGPELFIIPAELASGNHICIPGENVERYAGKWAHYRNAFSLLDECGATRKPIN